MSVLINLPETADAAAKQRTTGFRLWLAELAECDVENWPTATNATISTDVLKTGKKWHYIDTRINTMNPSAAAGESPQNGVLTLTPQFEGISKASLAWIYANAGKNFVAVWERCLDGQKFIGGSPCSGGLKLSVQNIGQIDGGLSGLSLQLQGGECPEPFLFYDADMDIAPDASSSQSNG